MSEKIKHTQYPWSVKGIQIHKVNECQICKVWCFGGDLWRGNAIIIALAPTAPHNCSDPKCPGNINRQIIEIFPALVDMLESSFYDEFVGSSVLADIISRARALQENSK